MLSLASSHFETYRLIEVIVPSEYNALSDANKERIKMILSCGTIDMRSGSFIREMIFGLFPEGTDTYSALAEMLTYIPPPGS